MNFNKYYASILRHPTRTEPRADEALRDYQELIRYTNVLGIF
jgi:hypothetical protein